jgi:hypothetical protein
MHQSPCLLHRIEIAQLARPRASLAARDARPARFRRPIAGTAHARACGMASSSESWTIPLHVIMWTVLLAGLVMVMAVILMH